MSHEVTSASSEDSFSSQRTSGQRKQGIRTQLLLVFAIALVTVTVTALFMLLIRHRLGAQVVEDLSQDLAHSVITFQNLQSERLAALERENALLAELPTLKALMTSGDDLTIQDGATEFWQLSGNDLFALADPNGRIVAVYAKGAAPDATLRASLKSLIASPQKQYLIDGSLLYACSLRPLYFGSDDDGTLLGYVISGISIERTVRQISEPTGVEATFLSDGHIVASTLDRTTQVSLANRRSAPSINLEPPSAVTLGGTRFLSSTKDLSAFSTSPLQLVVLKSFGPAQLWIARMDRMVLSTGLLAFLAGTLLMITLSRILTRPLEELSKSVKAFGMGDGTFRVPRHGTQEVRQLSDAFAAMREEIQQANRARLESERLATIGRMASSVSHDLRHYLAAVYANSEFLASDRLTLEERAEIFSDIRTAVLGTTDMIESLLVFSRTGTSLRRAPELMSLLLERATTLIRAHPDSHGVELIVNIGEPTLTAAFVDGRQIERAIYNLLLNACQAIRAPGTVASVTVNLQGDQEHMIVQVIDNGVGVPESIRQSLFDPFVSEGKQKGTGLGLTLSHCVAVEHGGEVILLRSAPGETVFQMSLTRGLLTEETTSPPEAELPDQVTAHEKLWT